MDKEEFIIRLSCMRADIEDLEGVSSDAKDEAYGYIGRAIKILTEDNGDN